ncbi:hypothetical protein CC80DRAFT_550463 [Byssothecium circinans]|uniref:Uncharacterized protein n=1 Tax=Byssothecium circinans TaxID=147558 RepID=A0A6A5TPS6_9PLEO|nr:hypothetical protein CC80DRAFT_550463 [Byssothecium circinans]
METLWWRENWRQQDDRKACEQNRACLREQAAEREQMQKCSDDGDFAVANCGMGLVTPILKVHNADLRTGYRANEEVNLDTMAPKTRPVKPVHFPRLNPRPGDPTYQPASEAPSSPNNNTHASNNEGEQEGGSDVPTSSQQPAPQRRNSTRKSKNNPEKAKTSDADTSLTTKSVDKRDEQEEMPCSTAANASSALQGDQPDDANVPEPPQNTSREEGDETKASRDRHRPSKGLRRTREENEIKLSSKDLEKPKHVFYSKATSPYANIKLSDTIPVTMAELLTFFPAHDDWEDSLDRIYHAGWSWLSASKFAIRGIDGFSLYDACRCRMQKATKRENKCTGNRDPKVSSDLTCKSWKQPEKINGNSVGQEDFVDYYVKDLGKGVLRACFPRDVHRGVLTQAVDYVLDPDHANKAECKHLRLSGLKKFVETKDFSKFVVQSDDGRPADYVACEVLCGFGRRRCAFVEESLER